MKQEPNLKIFIRKRPVFNLLNQKGQAVVEYILILIVTVTMLLATRGVFSSMNTFMSDFMGEYIVCLMEYGELPSLKVEETDLKNHTSGSDGKKCDYRKYSAAMTAVNSGQGSTGSGSLSSDRFNKKPNSSNSSNNSSAQNKSGKSSDRDGRSTSDSNSGSSSDSSGSARTKKTSPYLNGQISRGGYGTGDGSSSGDEKIKIIDEDLSKKGRNPITSNSSSSNRRRQNDSSKYKAITGNLAAEIEKRSRQIQRKPSSKTTLLSEEGYRFMPYKKTFTPPKIEKSVEETKEEDFSFGNIFKWLVIAGILIACFILFGGQVLNYSNSSE